MWSPGMWGPVDKVAPVGLLKLEMQDLLVEIPMPIMPVPRTGETRKIRIPAKVHFFQ